MHRGLLCPEGLREGARIIGFDLPDAEFRKLVAPGVSSSAGVAR
ncbi:MAG: hypothetical protein ACYDEA_01060 [Candidatus Dormibacteria bacterium]